MQFSRNLFATMMVALFGAIVLAGGSGAAARDQYSVEGFVHVFLGVAASFAIALTASGLCWTKSRWKRSSLAGRS